MTRLAGPEAERLRATLDVSVDITLGVLAAVLVAQILADLWRLTRPAAEPKLA